MLDLILSGFLLIAQDPEGEAGGPKRSPAYEFVFMGLTLAVMFYLLLIRPNQKKEKDRQALLSGLKKDDHVVTIGGIKGIVANVNHEDDEVVLKVDETTGAKLRMVRSSIARIVTTEDASAGKKES